jgi:RNA polymerase sigma-70 factor, ECF subfamily
MSADAIDTVEHEQPPQLLDPEGLPDHIDALYRAARAMCGSRYDAEDLVQETLAIVLRRPRWIQRGNELGYLLRALKRNHANLLRTAARRPATIELFEDQSPGRFVERASPRELMEAIASAPAPYRDAVIAVDVLGLSYRDAARSLRTQEATISSRLHRGRQHVAHVLLAETAPSS